MYGRVRLTGGGCRAPAGADRGAAVAGRCGRPAARRGTGAAGRAPAARACARRRPVARAPAPTRRATGCRRRPRRPGRGPPRCASPGSSSSTARRPGTARRCGSTAAKGPSTRRSRRTAACAAATRVCARRRSRPSGCSCAYDRRATVAASGGATRSGAPGCRRAEGGDEPAPLRVRVLAAHPLLHDEPRQVVPQRAGPRDAVTAPAAPQVAQGRRLRCPAAGVVEAAERAGRPREQPVGAVADGGDPGDAVRPAASRGAVPSGVTVARVEPPGPQAQRRVAGQHRHGLQAAVDVDLAQRHLERGHGRRSVGAGDDAAAADAGAQQHAGEDDGQREHARPRPAGRGRSRR